MQPCDSGFDTCRNSSEMSSALFMHDELLRAVMLDYCGHEVITRALLYLPWCIGCKTFNVLSFE